MPAWKPVAVPGKLNPASTPPTTIGPLEEDASVVAAAVPDHAAVPTPTTVAANDSATAADAMPRLPLRNVCTTGIAPLLLNLDKICCRALYIRVCRVGASSPLSFSPYSQLRTAKLSPGQLRRLVA